MTLKAYLVHNIWVKVQISYSLFSSLPAEIWRAAPTGLEGAAHQRGHAGQRHLRRVLRLSGPHWRLDRQQLREVRHGGQRWSAESPFSSAMPWPASVALVCGAFQSSPKKTWQRVYCTWSATTSGSWPACTPNSTSCRGSTLGAFSFGGIRLPCTPSPTASTSSLRQCWLQPWRQIFTLQLWATFAMKHFCVQGEVQALFLRHEGYLGAIGAFLKGAEEDSKSVELISHKIFLCCFFFSNTWATQYRHCFFVFF